MSRQLIRIGFFKDLNNQKVIFNFLFKSNGDLYITPNMINKDHRNIKISLHPPLNNLDSNYQSVSFQKIPKNKKNKDRHISITKGDFNKGSNLSLRQTLLIHSSVFNKHRMFSNKDTQIDIKLDKGETILEMKILSSKNKFIGTFNKKEGYQKLIEVKTNKNYMYVIFKGRRIYSEENNNISKMQQLKNTDGIFF